MKILVSEITNSAEKFKTKKAAAAIVWSLSNPEKMPCYSYGLPAKACNVGSKLAKIENSVCNNCYALKGRYVMPNVAIAQEKRLQAIYNPLWVSAMVKMLEKESFFRWHDSGDLQDFTHLLKLVEIAIKLPNCKFWLPTKEKGLINRYLKTIGDFPDNFIVRLSAAMINQETSLNGVLSSSVHTILPIGKACNAPNNDGFCGDCRECWDSNIKNVSYNIH